MRITRPAVPGRRVTMRITHRGVAGRRVTMRITRPAIPGRSPIPVGRPIPMSVRGVELRRAVLGAEVPRPRRRAADDRGGAIDPHPADGIDGAAAHASTRSAPANTIVAARLSQNL